MKLDLLIESIGGLLAERISQDGLSYREVARRLGMHHEQIARLVRGEMEISVYGPRVINFLYGGNPPDLKPPTNERKAKDA